MSHLDTKAGLGPSPMLKIAPTYSMPISVEVVFGVPGKNCAGVGICRILPLEHVRVHWKCPSARALMGVSIHGLVTLTFNRKDLLPEYVERYFKGQIFSVEEPYPIRGTILSALNLGQFTIESGQYFVEVSDEFLVVCF
jgi:hypothetical protein